MKLLKLMGARIRSRTEQIELDERSTKSSIGKERNFYDKKLITRIERPNGEIIEESKQIMYEIKHFYQQLYSSTIKDEDENQLQNYVNESTNIPLLNETEKSICEGNLTLDECYSSLKYFKNNKSPGCDGLTIEFYKTFWYCIGHKLVESLNFAKNKGVLSISQRRAVISLLHKKGKPEKHIKNWRPISLLNNDYKIMTKTLAKRLEKVVSTIVHSNQSGFVKGRFIGEGIRFMDDIIDYADKHNIHGLALQLDFEKAFDSVEWKFLITVLNKF